MANKIYLSYASPDLQFELDFLYQPSLTVGQLLSHANLANKYPNLSFDAERVGIWGKRVTLDTPLKPGDRVELYRPLRIDPKAARRLRVDKKRK